MFCSQCGKSIGDNENFCKYCGKKMVHNHVAIEHKKDCLPKYKWVIGIVVSVLIIFVVKGVSVLDVGKKAISVGGAYYGSYEECSGEMPLGIDDNVWGMSREEFEEYTGIFPVENTGFVLETFEQGYDMPIQHGVGYGTDRGSYLLFYEGYGLGTIVLEASSSSYNGEKKDLAGEMLNWLEEYGTYINKTHNNRYILYEFDKCYAFFQNFYLDRCQSVYICYVSKEVQNAGLSRVSDIDYLLKNSLDLGDEENEGPLIELFYEDLLMLTIWPDDIKEKSVKVMEGMGETQSEYAIQIELKQEKADELKKLTSSYMGKIIKIQTLRTEAEDIEVSSVIKNGKIYIGYFEDEENAEIYANWLKEAIQ